MAIKCKQKENKFDIVETGNLNLILVIKLKWIN